MMFSEFASQWVGVLVANAVVAGGLALAGWLVWRRWQNAPLAHALMLLALLKLIAPPLFDCGFGLDFGLWPSAQPAAVDTVWAAEPVADAWIPVVGVGDSPVEGAVLGSARADEQRTGAVGSLPTEDASVVPVDGVRFGVWLFGVWLIGAAVVSLLIWRRARRCRILLERADDAPPAVRAAVVSLGQCLRLRRLPAVRVVRAPVMPFVCSVRGTMTVILPQELVDRVSAEDLQAVLAHELAHVANRDHWVRRLELLACIVHWWNPVSWRIRSALSAMGEHRCDARAVELLNSGARRYGRALLRVTSSLAPTQTPLPLSASGLGGESILKQRLTMIAENKLSHRLSTPARCALLLGASALLPLGLVAQGPEKKGGSVDKAAIRKAVLKALREHGIEVGKPKKKRAHDVDFWVEKKADSDGAGTTKVVRRWVELQGDGDAEKDAIKKEWRAKWNRVFEAGKGGGGHWVTSDGDGKKVMLWTDGEGKSKWKILGGDGHGDENVFVVVDGDGDAEQKGIRALKKVIAEQRAKAGKGGFSWRVRSTDDKHKDLAKLKKAAAEWRVKLGKKAKDAKKMDWLSRRKAIAELHAKAGDSDGIIVLRGDDAAKKHGLWLKKGSQNAHGEHEIYVFEGKGDAAKKKALLRLKKGGEGHFLFHPKQGKPVRIEAHSDAKSDDVEVIFAPGKNATKRRVSLGDNGELIVVREHQDGDLGDRAAKAKKLRVRLDRAHGAHRKDDIRALEAKIKALKKKLKALKQAAGQHKKTGKTMV